MAMRFCNMLLFQMSHLGCCACRIFMGTLEYYGGNQSVSKKLFPFKFGHL